MVVPAYVLSPLARVSRLHADGKVVVRGGSGFDRQCVEIAGEREAPALVIRWILSRTTPAKHDELAGSLAAALGTPNEAAAALVEQFIEAAVLAEADTAARLAVAMGAWSRYGWDDAARFHQATFGQRFDPDMLGDLDYDSYYRSILVDTSTAGPQPPVVKPLLAHPGDVCPSKEPEYPVPFGEVLANAAQVNRFQRTGIELRALHAALLEAAGAQRVIGGVLGAHLLKAHPSGGARHPCEVYVCAKTVSGLAKAVYHFDPVVGALHRVAGSDAADDVDTACFGKGGITTASAVLVLTCRWPRHNWKYRYSRSYRMVMLELGHLVQAIHLSTVSRGLNVYHCPSIDDARFIELLRLADDCAEGRLYALGIGREGVR